MDGKQIAPACVWSGHPATVVLMDSGRSSEFPFYHDDGPDECWAWIGDMTGAGWIASRDGDRLVLTFSLHQTWGTA